MTSLSTAVITATPCPVCEADILLAAPPLDPRLLGCARCAAFLSSGIPTWIDANGHYWWVTLDDRTGTPATLSVVLANQQRRQQFVSHRLRCAGIAPLGIQVAQDHLKMECVLVEVTLGDWREAADVARATKH